MPNSEQQVSASGKATVSQSKRAVLKAGWVAPVVVALSLPAVSFNANASGKACVPGNGPPDHSKSKSPVDFCPK